MSEIDEFSTEKPIDSTEKPIDSTEKPIDSTEKPIDSTEKPIDSTKEIDSNTDKTLQIPEKRSIGQRGKDKKPRKVNPNSLRNLKPFQNLSEKENLIVSQKGIILERDKPVWKKAEFWGAIGGITALFILVWKLKEAMDKAREDKDVEES